MNIVLIDLTDTVYTLDSLESGPLSGSQTMLCLLARWLVARGDQIALVSRHAPHDRVIGGVRHLNAHSLAGVRLTGTDLAIVLNNTTAPVNARRLVGADCRCLYWMHNDSESASADSFAEPGYLDGVDGLVFVSAWQARRFAARFRPSVPCHVIGNAITPPFETLLPAGSPILDGKDPDLIAYASAPNRGLEPLAQLFPGMKAARPRLKLEIHSGFVMDQGGYFDEPNTRRFEGLLARMAGMDGVTVVRGLGKADFAQRLKRVALLCYPCVFPETCSITVMEAMAAGCALSLTDVGALAETANGFARLSAFSGGSLSGQSFIDNTLMALAALQDDRAAAEAMAQAQVAFARGAYGWNGRAAAWDALLSSPVPAAT